MIFIILSDEISDSKEISLIPPETASLLRSQNSLLKKFCSMTVLIFIYLHSFIEVFTWKQTRYDRHIWIFIVHVDKFHCWISLKHEKWGNPKNVRLYVICNILKCYHRDRMWHLKCVFPQWIVVIECTQNVPMGHSHIKCMVWSSRRLMWNSSHIITLSK